MFLGLQRLSNDELKSLLLFIKLNEKESQSRPNQLTKSYNQCHKDTCTGRYSQCRCRHKKASFSSAKLQRNKEKQVCKETGKG